MHRCSKQIIYKEVIIRILPFFPYSIDEDDVVRLADGNLSRVWGEGHVLDHVALLPILQQRVLLSYITMPTPYYIQYVLGVHSFMRK